MRATYEQLQVGNSVELLEEIKLNKGLVLSPGSLFRITQKDEGVIVLDPIDADSRLKIKESVGTSFTVTIIGDPDNRDTDIADPSQLAFFTPVKIA